LTIKNYFECRLPFEIFLFGGRQPTSAETSSRRRPRPTTMPEPETGKATKLKWRYDPRTRDIVYLI